MKLAKWLVAGVVSYVATIWIKNFWINFVASTIIWFVMLYILDKFLEGEI